MNRHFQSTSIQRRDTIRSNVSCLGSSRKTPRACHVKTAASPGRFFVLFCVLWRVVRYFFPPPPLGRGKPLPFSEPGLSTPLPRAGASPARTLYETRPPQRIRACPCPGKWGKIQRSFFLLR